MTRFAVFTDASRVMNDDNTYDAAFGWVAIDYDKADSPFLIPHVEVLTVNAHSSVLAEVMAVQSAAKTFGKSFETFIYTDSLYASYQVEKARSGMKRRPIKVLPEVINQLARNKNIEVSHIKAHSSYFFNELVDKMVGFVARREMDTFEAEAWALETFKKGVIELTITKGSKPKFIRFDNEKNLSLLSVV